MIRLQCGHTLAHLRFDEHNHLTACSGCESERAAAAAQRRHDGLMRRYELLAANELDMLASVSTNTCWGWANGGRRGRNLHRWVDVEPTRLHTGTSGRAYAVDPPEWVAACGQTTTKIQVARYDPGAKPDWRTPSWPTAIKCKRCLKKAVEFGGPPFALTNLLPDAALWVVQNYRGYTRLVREMARILPHAGYRVPTPADVARIEQAVREGLECIPIETA